MIPLFKKNIYLRLGSSIRSLVRLRFATIFLSENYYKFQPCSLARKHNITVNDPPCSDIVLLVRILNCRT